MVCPHQSRIICRLFSVPKIIILHGVDRCNVSNAFFSDTVSVIDVELSAISLSPWWMQIHWFTPSTTSVTDPWIGYRVVMQEIDDTSKVIIQNLWELTLPCPILFTNLQLAHFCRLFFEKCVFVWKSPWPVSGNETNIYQSNEILTLTSFLKKRWEEGVQKSTKEWGLPTDRGNKM